MHPFLLLLLTRVSLFRARPRDDRGDVPGWVLITVMTAGLVAVIWGVAEDQLRDMLRNALNSVRD